MIARMIAWFAAKRAVGAQETGAAGQRHQLPHDVLIAGYVPARLDADAVMGGADPHDAVEMRRAEGLVEQQLPVTHLRLLQTRGIGAHHGPGLREGAQMLVEAIENARHLRREFRPKVGQDAAVFLREGSEGQAGLDVQRRGGCCCCSCLRHGAGLPNRRLNVSPVFTDAGINKALTMAETARLIYAARRFSPASGARDRLRRIKARGMDHECHQHKHAKRLMGEGEPEGDHQKKR